jgi:3-oxoacyl-[acyl-carrier protein] reductase
MRDPDAAGTALYPGLRGRVALVTGGSKGIGAATCRALARNGVRVAVNAREPEAVDALVGELRDLGTEALAVPGDACDRATLTAVRERVEAELGPVSLLAPFAGGFDAFTPITEIGDDEWDEVVDRNLRATFLALSVFLPPMLEAGDGAIVTMASNGARALDKPLTASYVAAKAGVVQLTRHVAHEVGPRGVRVNCVAPATVTTERIERIMSADAMAFTAALSPLGTMGTADDAAQAALFLLSESARWITGLTLDVSGGRVML